MRKLLNVLALLSAFGTPALAEAFASGEKTGKSAGVQSSASTGRAYAQDLRPAVSRPTGAAKRRKAGQTRNQDRPAEKPDHPYAACAVGQSPASPNFGACNTM